MKKGTSKSRLINIGKVSDEIPMEKGLYDITSTPMAFSKKKGKKKLSGEWATWMSRGLGPKGIKIKDVPGWNKIKAFKEWREENNNLMIKESLDRNVLYHTTSTERLESILKHGLMINSKSNYSMASLHHMEEIYGMIPIFVSLSPYMYGINNEDTVTLKIDGKSLTLVSDIPSLIDKGAYLDEEMQGIWFKRGRNIIDPIADPEIIYFDDLLDPYNEYCKRSIEITKTAAVLNDISPERITIING